MSTRAPGFPLPQDAFDGGSLYREQSSTATAPKGLRELLAALELWIQVRGWVGTPADLAGVASPEDGWMIAVRESAGPGTPPALYIYNADTTTWMNLLSTGLPANHATTHITGADPVAVTVPANDSIPMTPSAPAAAVLDAWITANAAAAVASLRQLGVGATDACAGNDARLSDARTPTAHAPSHKPGGSDALDVAPTVPGVYPYSVLLTDETILGTGAGAPGNDANLPASATTPLGHKVRLVNYAGGGAVNLVPNGADTINGVAAAHPLPLQYDSVTVEYVGGGDWLIIATA